MSEVQVVLHGYVGQEITLKQMGRFDMATFRVGTTPRWRDRQGAYHNGETVWTSVTCWRELAQNVKASVHVGDPVVIVGKYRAERWQSPEGDKRERYFVDATTVAHDLARGTSIFRKNPRRDQPAEEREGLAAILEEAERSPVSIDPVTGEPLYPVGSSDRNAVGDGGQNAVGDGGQNAVGDGERDAAGSGGPAEDVPGDPSDRAA